VPCDPTPPPARPAPPGASMPRLLAALVPLLLTACAATPPAPAPVARLLDPAFHATPADARGDWSAAAWWTALGDPALDGLLQRAAQANLDGRIAWERVLAARAGVTQLRSRGLPTLALGGSASDERSGLPAPVKQGKPDTRALRSALQLDWEIDLRGSAAAQADAGALDALAAEGAWEAARWQAQHELARQYLTWQGTRLRLDALARLLEAQWAIERLTRSRETAGLASRFDVDRARADAQALQAWLPPLQALLQVSEHAVAVLIAEPPGRGVPALAQAGAPRLPAAAPLPVGQPVALLSRRPDLVIAERQWQAETARLRAADADRWPQLFLSAVLGGQDLRLNGLDLAPVRYSNVALAFSVPIFNAGRLQAAVDRQSAQQRAAALQYEQAVLRALQDVENSLVALSRNGEREQRLADTLASRRQAMQRADSLRREGQIDQLQWLDAQRSLVSAELDHIDAREQRALGQLQLYRALGGGWAWPSPPAAPAAPTAPATPPAPPASPRTPA